MNRPYFLLFTAIYVAISFFVWFQIKLSCGLGPDSPEACNSQADKDALIFVVGSVITFTVLAAVFRRCGTTGAK